MPKYSADLSPNQTWIFLCSHGIFIFTYVIDVQQAPFMDTDKSTTIFTEIAINTSKKTLSYALTWTWKTKISYIPTVFNKQVFYDRLYHFKAYNCLVPHAVSSLCHWCSGFRCCLYCEFLANTQKLAPVAVHCVQAICWILTSEQIKCDTSHLKRHYVHQ